MTQKIRTVRLYGKLGTKFGREFRLAVNSPAEAIYALSQMIPGFQRHMVQSKDHGVGYAVFVGKRNLTQDELGYPPGNDDIRIAPILLGAKSGGLFNIILGAALIVVGVMTAGWAIAGVLISPAIIGAGISMVIGGVVQLLTPMPKGSASKDDPGQEASYTFNGTVNTQSQGNPVPLLYGRMRVGSAVISAGISLEAGASGSTGVAGDSGDNMGGGYYKNYGAE